MSEDFVKIKKRTIISYVICFNKITTRLSEQQEIKILKVDSLEIKTGDSVAIADEKRAIRFNYSLLDFDDSEVKVFNRLTKRAETYSRKKFESWQVSPEAKYRRTGNS